MEMSWLQSIKDLKYLLFLLVPVGIYLVVIGIKKVRLFAKAKMIYEMPVSLIDGSFKLDESGKYELTYIYATNQIFEKREGDFHKSLKKKSFDPREILPPAAVVNFAYAQTQGKATSLNAWSVHYDKGKIVYKVSFGTEGDKEVDVRIDAMNGTLLSVKFDD